MKFRQGFVTNSSSSSYVVQYKVLYLDLVEVLTKVKEEHGTRGLIKLFSDVRPSSENQLIFASGKNEDLEELFDSINSNLFETESHEESW